jgi:hypothetical protein
LSITFLKMWHSKFNTMPADIVWLLWNTKIMVLFSVLYSGKQSSVGSFEDWVSNVSKPHIDTVDTIGQQ